MITNDGTFSADVRLYLHAGNERFALGHLGPDFAMLGEARDIDASEAELKTIIDGQSTRWKVHITSPITEALRRFTFKALENLSDYFQFPKTGDGS